MLSVCDVCEGRAEGEVMDTDAVYSVMLQQLEEDLDAALDSPCSANTRVSLQRCKDRVEKMKLLLCDIAANKTRIREIIHEN